MAVSEIITSNEKADEGKNLFPYLFVSYNGIYEKLKTCLKNFSRKPYITRFMGITKGENLFYYGDEYFVNKIKINRQSEVKIKISSQLIERLLEDALGSSEHSFVLDGLTDLEALLIKDLTTYIYDNISEYINKNEINKNLIKDERETDFTFFVSSKSGHAGKIIISMPEFVLKNKPVSKHEERFSIADYSDIETAMSITPGRARLSLNDIKCLEAGDIMVLDDSNIETMAVLLNDEPITFNIRPNPSLIIGSVTEGENEMPEETDVKTNMWDSILVDVVAEFNDVKMTLGDLKQISEGLVIDVGSVYNNEIKLRVENQTIATGELVIINDRYGVKINEVTKVKAEEEEKNEPAPQEAPKPTKEKAPRKKAAKKEEVEAEEAQTTPADENENFDYSDFEIEDESI